MKCRTLGEPAATRVNVAAVKVPSTCVVVTDVQELLTWRSTAAPAFERPYATPLSGKWGPAPSFDLRASAGIGSQRLLSGAPLETQASVVGSEAIQAVHVRLLSTAYGDAEPLTSQSCVRLGAEVLQPLVEPQ